MIDAQMLHEHSFKYQLEQSEAKCIAQGEKPNPVVRTSDTVHGFLGIEEANRLLAQGDPDLLVVRAGIVAISDRNVVFLAGEGSYAWQLLKPRGFLGMSLRLPSRMPCADDHRVHAGVMRTAEELLRVYYDDRVHLDTIEELLAYLNHGQLPSDARLVSERFGKSAPVQSAVAAV